MTEQAATARVAVLGLGNELMADDGIGVHAVRRLRDVLPPDVECLEIGTAVLQAQAICEQVDVVVAIDAVQAGGPPGSIYAMDIADAAMPTSESLHNLSLAGLITMIPSGKRPRVVVVGIEPARLEYDLGLSPEVEAALPDVVHRVNEIVHLARRTDLRDAVLTMVAGNAAASEENL